MGTREEGGTEDRPGRRTHWGDCATNYGGECDMGTDCGGPEVLRDIADLIEYVQENVGVIYGGPDVPEITGKEDALEGLAEIRGKVREMVAQAERAGTSSADRGTEASASVAKLARCLHIDSWNVGVRWCRACGAHYGGGSQDGGWVLPYDVGQLRDALAGKGLPACRPRRETWTEVLAPYPFDGCDRCELWSTPHGTEEDGDRDYYVVCPACACQGPWRKNPGGAVERWDRRAADVRPRQDDF